MTAEDAVKTVLASVTERRYVSDSVFNVWLDLHDVMTNDLWSMFYANKREKTASQGKVDVTMTFRDLCKFLLRKGLLRGWFDKSQLEAALKVDIRPTPHAKLFTRKTTGLDEISITEGSLLGALNAESSLVALKVEDVDWTRCFSLGNVVHALVQVLSPTNVAHIKLNPSISYDQDSLSFEDLFSYELCFFEFVRVLYTLVEVRAEEVHGLKVDVDVIQRFSDFVSKVLSTTIVPKPQEEPMPSGWYELKLDIN
jgi:hypothetical protein